MFYCPTHCLEYQKVRRTKNKKLRIHILDLYYLNSTHTLTNNSKDKEISSNMPTRYNRESDDCIFII